MEEHPRLTGLAEAVSRAARAAGRTVGAAESLTGGELAARLAASTNASEWFRGGIVAYASEVKYDLLGVPRGPVVSGPSAEAMASGARRLLRADVVVSLTGVGGPDPQDGQPPGVVWLGLDDDGQAEAVRYEFDDDGGPAGVCEQAVEAALLAVERALARD